MSRLDPVPARYLINLAPDFLIQICGLDPARKKYLSWLRLRRTRTKLVFFFIFTDWFQPVFSLFFRQIHRGDRVLCHGDSITREEKILGLVCWLSLQCMHIQNSCVYCIRQQPSFSTRLLLTCRLFQTSKWVVGPRDAIAIARTSPTRSRGSTGTVFNFLYKLGWHRILFGSFTDYTTGQGCLPTSVPDPGSDAFLTPGSEIRNRVFPDPGSNQIKNQNHLFPSTDMIKIL